VNDPGHLIAMADPDVDFVYWSCEQNCKSSLWVCEATLMLLYIMYYIMFWGLGFGLSLQVVSTHLGPVDRAYPCKLGPTK
jgi:hypothetical protein